MEQNKTQAGPSTIETTGGEVELRKERPLRVLVADDNRDNVDCCAMLFKMSGHDVRTAYSGHEALKVAAEFGPHFMLLDIGMPEMNGYEVARQIRHAQWGKHTVLVAVTGWDQEGDKRQAEAMGFDHHLTKPVDFQVIRELLKQCRTAD